MNSAIASRMTDNMDTSIGIKLSNEAIEIVSGNNIMEPEFCVNKKKLIRASQFVNRYFYFISHVCHSNLYVNIDLDYKDNN